MDENELRIKIKLFKKEYTEKKKTLLPGGEEPLCDTEKRKIALIFANTLIDYGLAMIEREKILPKVIRYPFPEKEINKEIASEVVNICKDNRLHVHWNYERGYIVFVILP